MTAFLFDLDGLLVDSEAVHFRAYQETLNPYGIDITQEMFIESWLSGTRYGTRYYLDEAGHGDKFDEARAQKAESFRQHAIGHLELMPGVAEFLERVQAAGIPMGIGTGGYQHEYSFTMKQCGLDKIISVAVGGDEVEKNKPGPDVYLEAARQLGVDPATCIVFENSDIGMHAAINAGMKCVTIPSRWTTHQDFDGAWKQLKQINEFDLGWIDQV